MAEFDISIDPSTLWAIANSFNEWMGWPLLVKSPIMVFPVRKNLALRESISAKEEPSTPA